MENIAISYSDRTKFDKPLYNIFQFEGLFSLLCFTILLACDIGYKDPIKKFGFLNYFLGRSNININKIYFLM